jgi:hypothetical protein
MNLGLSDPIMDATFDQEDNQCKAKSYKEEKESSKKDEESSEGEKESSEGEEESNEGEEESSEGEEESSEEEEESSEEEEESSEGEERGKGQTCQCDYTFQVIFRNIQEIKDDMRMAEETNAFGVSVVLGIIIGQLTWSMLSVMCSAVGS